MPTSEATGKFGQGLNIAIIHSIAVPEPHKDTFTLFELFVSRGGWICKHLHCVCTNTGRTVSLKQRCQTHLLLQAGSRQQDSSWARSGLGRASGTVPAQLSLATLLPKAIPNGEGPHNLEVCSRTYPCHQIPRSTKNPTDWRKQSYRPDLACEPCV